MATNLKIVESSFRIGCGRYIQEDNAVLKLGEEVRRLHCQNPLVIGGKTAFSLTTDLIRKSLAESGLQAEYSEYHGFCNPDRGAKIADSMLRRNLDCIIGVGGGNVMDVAKLIAALNGVPVINIPTSSATCAAYTPLSVMYNDRGQTIGSRHHQQEVNVILADLNILCRQPTRLLVAGIYDALAKPVEIRQRLAGKTEDEIDIGLRTSYVLSQFVFDRLLQNLSQTFDDVKQQRNTQAVSDTVYLTIAVTGIVSGLARGSNQCAIAHKIYESTRTLFPELSRDCLHGELVAIGLLPQLLYNGDNCMEQTFRTQMKQVGIPCKLTDIGIPSDCETQHAYYDCIAKSSAMAGSTPQEHEKLKDVLSVIF